MVDGETGGITNVSEGEGGRSLYSTHTTEEEAGERPDTVGGGPFWVIGSEQITIIDQIVQAAMRVIVQANNAYGNAAWLKSGRLGVGPTATNRVS